jgi:hypothetical protein
LSAVLSVALSAALSLSLALSVALSLSKGLAEVKGSVEVKSSLPGVLGFDAPLSGALNRRTAPSDRWLGSRLGACDAVQKEER